MEASPLPAGTFSPSEERMQVALEELQDLKGVWSELSKVWEQIDDLKERPWLSVQPRKVTVCLTIPPMGCSLMIEACELGC